jgi:hypothetical protein
MGFRAPLLTSLAARIEKESDGARLNEGDGFSEDTSVDRVIEATKAHFPPAQARCTITVIVEPAVVKKISSTTCIASPLTLTPAFPHSSSGMGITHGRKERNW